MTSNTWARFSGSEAGSRIASVPRSASSPVSAIHSSKPSHMPRVAAEAARDPAVARPEQAVRRQRMLDAAPPDTRVGVDVRDRARLERRRDALQRGDLDPLRSSGCEREQHANGGVQRCKVPRLVGRRGPRRPVRPPDHRDEAAERGDDEIRCLPLGTRAGRAERRHHDVDRAWRDRRRPNVAGQRSFEHDVRGCEQGFVGCDRALTGVVVRERGRGLRRSADPPGGSTSTTSAPISQSSRPACAVRGLSYSRTRSPSSGFTRCASPTPARSRARDGRCRARHRDGRRSSAPRAARRRAQRGRTSRGIRSG